MLRPPHGWSARVKHLIRLLILCSIARVAVAAGGGLLDAPPWSVGDEWTYKVTDYPNSGGAFASPETTFKVSEIKDEVYILDRRDTADPPKLGRPRFTKRLNALHRVGPGGPWSEFLRYRWPLQSGTDWKTQYDQPEGSVTTHWNVAVVGAERVTVAAGTFDAIRVDGWRTNEGGASGRIQERWWYAPAVKRHVKLEHWTYDQLHSTWLTSHWVEELVRYHVE